jgi:hypothetical protein
MEPTSSAMVAQYSNTKYDCVLNIHRAQKIMKKLISQFNIVITKFVCQLHIKH